MVACHFIFLSYGYWIKSFKDRSLENMPITVPFFYATLIMSCANRRYNYSFIYIYCYKHANQERAL